MQVLLVEEELHGFVWPLVDGGRGVVVAGAPVRSGDRRLGYVEGVLGPGSRGGRGVIQIEQTPGLLAGGVRGGRGGGRGGGGGGHAVVGRRGGRRARRRRHSLVEVGLEQADRALLGGLHRAGFRHLDGRRISKVRSRASARRTRRRRARRRSRAQRPDARRLWRQGWLAGHWRPPVCAAKTNTLVNTRFFFPHFFSTLSPLLSLVVGHVARRFPSRRFFNKIGALSQPIRNKNILKNYQLHTHGALPMLFIRKISLLCVVRT